MRRNCYLITIISALLRYCFGFTSADHCLREPDGSAFAEPPQIFSSNGRLLAILRFVTVSIAEEDRFCYIQINKRVSPPTLSQSPTLRVFPGDTLFLKLVNQMPESGVVLFNLTGNSYCQNKTATTSSTNLHFHGLEIAPICHDDNVLTTVVNAGESFVYDFALPATQPPGLYWYHPHVPSLATQQAGGGASGAIVVEGIERVQPLVAGLWEQLLVFRQGEAAPLSLNLVEIRASPVEMAMKPGQRQFWRIINACIETDLELFLLYDGVPQNLTIVSLDGVVVGTGETAEPYNVSSIMVVTGGRAELIVVGPPLGASALLVASAVPIPLLSITASEDAPDPSHSLPPLGASPSTSFVRVSADLMTVAPAAQHTLVFTQNTSLPHNLRWWVTADNDPQTLFHPNIRPAIVSDQGTVEDWTIVNRTPQPHNFHIHQMHFVLLAQDGRPLSPVQQQYRDVVEVPAQTFSDEGELVDHNITIRVDFTRPETVGLFVYHCHILLHEDHGMMAVIQVRAAPSQSPTSQPSAVAGLASGDSSTARGCEVGSGWLIYVAMACLFVILVLVSALMRLIAAK